MTAKEAKAKAAAFDSIKDNIIYKKIEKLIDQASSKGQYQVFVNLSEGEIEWFYGSFNYGSIEQGIKAILEYLCGKGFDIEAKIYKRYGTQYEIKIGWSCEHETGSLKYI